MVFIMDTCPVCKQALSHAPKLLPCLHSACHECLESKIINPEAELDSEEKSSCGPDSDHRLVRCPECSVEACLPRGGIRSLPEDPRTQDSLVQRCQLCSNTQSMAFCQCEECALFMCALCAETHIKFGDIGGHSIVQLKETWIRSSQSDQIWCSRHPSEESSYFCWDCRTSVCTQCCSGHKLEDFNGAATKITSNISEAMTSANTALKNVASISNTAATLTTCVNEQCEAVTAQVDQFIECYKEAIEAHHTALLAQIEKIREKRIDIAKESIDRVDRWATTANHILQFSGFLTSSASTSQVVSIGAWVLDRLAEVSSPSSFLKQPNVSTWLQFLPDGKPTNNTKFLLTGIISTQAVSPFYSSLDSPGILNCKQHIRATFVLKTRDSENKVLSHGGEKIIAEAKYKDASQRVLPVEVSDEGDGSYSISFIPDAFGTLLLYIFVQNTQIKGSPYTVAVSSTRQHKGVFHCCAFCSSGGNKNATCACRAKMPGGYQGCGHGHIGHPGRRHWSCCANVLQNSECGRPLTHQYSF